MLDQSTFACVLQLPPPTEAAIYHSLKTKLTYSPNGYNLLIFYFFSIIHSALKDRENGQLQGFLLGSAVLEGSGMMPADFGFTFDLHCLSLLNPPSLPITTA